MLRRCLSTSTRTMTHAPTRALTLTHLSKAVDKLVPLSLAERSWDNVGLLVEAPKEREVEGNKSVMCCIDLTTPVLREALASTSTTAILTYHPPIFSGLKSLTLQTPLQRSLLECVSNGISVFCIHTAADNALQGVNDFMGEGLLKASRSKGGKGSCQAITVKEDAPEGQEGAGSGRLVDLGEELTKLEVVAAVKETLGRDWIQAAFTPYGPETIKTVAICAGSGGGVLKGVKADLWLTGELGHHEILAANAEGIHVLVCNHSATERPWLSSFAPRLQQAMNDAADKESYDVWVSQEDHEPLVVV